MVSFNFTLSSTFFSGANRTILFSIRHQTSEILGAYSPLAPCSVAVAQLTSLRNIPRSEFLAFWKLKLSGLAQETVGREPHAAIYTEYFYFTSFRSEDNYFSSFCAEEKLPLNIFSSCCKTFLKAIILLKIGTRRKHKMIKTNVTATNMLHARNLPTLLQMAILRRNLIMSINLKFSDIFFNILNFFNILYLDCLE